MSSGRHSESPLVEEIGGAHEGASGRHLCIEACRDQEQGEG